MLNNVTFHLCFAPVLCTTVPTGKSLMFCTQLQCSSFPCFVPFNNHLRIQFTINALTSFQHISVMNSLHRLLNCEIGGLDCHVITTEYRTRVQFIHMYHLFCYTLVHVTNREYLVDVLIHYLNMFSLKYQLPVLSKPSLIGKPQISKLIKVVF